MLTQLTINGQIRTLALDPRRSLLDLLRENLQLTGTKKRCDQGACGSLHGAGGRKRIISCLTLAVMHDGANVTTIEGLAQGKELHPLQARIGGLRRVHSGAERGSEAGRLRPAQPSLRRGAGERRMARWQAAPSGRLLARPGLR